MDSILNTIKKMIGFDPEYEAFDIDLIVHINSSFSVLNQLGLGPVSGFSISNAESLWSDYSTQPTVIEMAKQYIYYKTKLAFDPPASSSAANAIQTAISELEWRINIQVENDLNT